MQRDRRRSPSRRSALIAEGIDGVKLLRRRILRGGAEALGARVPCIAIGRALQRPDLVEDKKRVVTASALDSSESLARARPILPTDALRTRLEHLESDELTLQLLDRRVARFPVLVEERLKPADRGGVCVARAAPSTATSAQREH